MIPKPLNEITESDVQRLKDNGVPEGKTIEYKRELPGTSNENKREFLADVSSFSNTEGGDIIYGVAEEQGVITNVVGLSTADFDTEILRLENLIHDGISPRIRAGCRPVPCAAGKLLVIRIEKSWIGPHRVKFCGHDKFYGRHSAGKLPLDVDQLRTAFLQSRTLSEQITGFRVDRMIDIGNDRAALPLVKAPTLVLHIIPLGAFSEQTQFDVTPFHKNLIHHCPWKEGNCSQRMTFDGVLLHAYEDGNGRIRAYTHFYRSGILEAVTTSLLEGESGKKLIPHGKFEGGVLEYLPECFKSLQAIGVRPPVSVSLTLLGIRGLRLAMEGGNEIREEALIIPDALVEDFLADPDPILKPMFDRVWNACGLLVSKNFDAEGKWLSSR